MFVIGNGIFYVCRVSGLKCILITDRDAVPLLKLQIDKEFEAAMRPSFLSSFTMAIDQAGKLGLGKSKNIISVYADYQVKCIG